MVLKLKQDLPTAFVITTNTIFVENEENFERTCVRFFFSSLFCQRISIQIQPYTHIYVNHIRSLLRPHTQSFQLPEFVDLAKIKRYIKFLFTLELDKSKSKQFHIKQSRFAVEIISQMCMYLSNFSQNLFCKNDIRIQCSAQLLLCFERCVNVKC